MGIRPQELLGVDFSASYVKIAQVRLYPNKKELSAVLIKKTAGLSDEEIARLIQDAAKELKTGRCRVVLTVPASQVISKNIEVPSVDHAEIREIINLQAGRHTPYAREEVIVDYIAIATNKKSYTKVLLLIVPGSAVKRSFAILEKAGLSVDRVVLAQEAIAAQYPGIFKLIAPGTVSAVIQIDEAASDCLIIARHKVLFIRSIPIGRQQLISDAEKSLAKFSDEVKKSLEAYQTENIEGAVESLIVTGAVSGLEHVEPALHEALQIPLAVKAFTAEGMNCTEKATRALRETQDVSFVSAVAALAAFAECKVNLVPEEIQLKKQLAQRSKDILKAGILALALLALAFMTFITKVYFHTAYLKELESRYSAETQGARALEKDLEKIKLVGEKLKSRGGSVAVLTEIHRLLPSSMELSEIRFEREGKFVVRGTAESMGSVYAFVDSLTKSKYFESVKPRNVNKRSEGKKEITDFEIQSSLRKDIP